MTREKYGREYEAGSHRTIGYLLSRGVPRDIAPDIAQSAWLRGWEKISQLRNDAMLTTWINTIALNTFRRALFRDRIFSELNDSSWSGTLNEAAIEVSQLLKHCRIEDRILLQEKMAGSTSEEIADQRGVTATSIRLRFLRARRALREHGRQM
jgi:DNA-directed RNA polymerase specialized sigma24 family protein